MTTDSIQPKGKPLYRRWAAIAVLVAGGAWIARTISVAKKEQAEFHITLPSQMRGLRLDVHQADSGKRLIAHLEWNYVQPSPEGQDAHLELFPGPYVVTLQPLGRGRDPGPLDLRVARGETARLAIDLRQP